MSTVRVGINATTTGARVSCGQCDTSFELPVSDGNIPGYSHQCNGTDEAWRIEEHPVSAPKRRRRARLAWRFRSARYRLASFIAGFDVTG